MRRMERAGADQRGLLARLRHDTKGNTLAIMAAALVPLIGFAGSAVDMSRLYVVKARLQQACDAGVLAGRKSMTDTNVVTPLDATATAAANTFFANNFRQGFYQTANVSFTPTKGVQGVSLYADSVNGKAKTDVPMALMQFFGLPTVTLNVACQAVYDTGDNDIMFVLDTTGSMSCYPSDPDTCANGNASYKRDDGTQGYYSPEKSQTTDSNGNPMYAKLTSLRKAVTLFDSTMRSSSDQSSHFRYGFVPYNSAVNVGASIPSGYLQNTTWTYQSRQVNGDYNYGSAASVSFSSTKSFCVSQRYPATGYSMSGPSWSTSYYQAVNYSNTSWNGNSGGTCSATQQPVRAVWRYQPYSLNISQYVNSYGSTGTAVPNPSRLDGSTSKWRGCIEEVNTTPGATSFDVNNLPDDLNPDFAPSSSADKWRPMWQDVEWPRGQSPSQDVNDDFMTTYEDYNPSNNWQSYALGNYPYLYNYGIGHLWEQYGFAACPMTAQRLKVMSAQDVQNYVNDNDFRAFGGTYHDTGMIWGTRMLSPTGVFASDTAAWSGRTAPARSIVFMTDGFMSTNPYIYGQYGNEQLDLRIDGSTSNMGSSSATPAWDAAIHSARFRVECDAAKARGITVYTVALGTAVTSDLQYCASPGQSFSAYNTTDLTTAFQTIAQRISMLRISQ